MAVRDGPTAYFREALFLRFIEWLHEEIGTGYRGTVWDRGVAMQVYASNGFFPTSAVDTMADYHMLTVGERVAAIQRAMAIVQAELDRVSPVVAPKSAPPAPAPYVVPPPAEEESERDRMREVFLDWLDAEAAGGYENSIGKSGVAGVVREYTEYLPDEAILALSDYRSLSYEEREDAVSLAISAVVREVGDESEEEGTDDHAGDAVGYPSGAGLHPDYATWAGLAGVQKESVAVPGAIRSPILPLPEHFPPTSIPRAQSVERLRTMPYDEYLQTEHWQHVRQAALERAERRCQVCDSPYRLQVHHRTYERRGQERDTDLTVLCDTCHGRFHQQGRLYSGSSSYRGSYGSRSYRKGRYYRSNAGGGNSHYGVFVLGVIAALALLLLVAAVTHAQLHLSWDGRTYSWSF